MHLHQATNTYVKLSAYVPILSAAEGSLINDL